MNSAGDHPKWLRGKEAGKETFTYDSLDFPSSAPASSGTARFPHFLKLEETLFLCLDDTTVSKSLDTRHRYLVKGSMAC